jgi:hypothetical protein
MKYELAKQLKEAGFPQIHFCCKKEDHDCRADEPDCIIKVLSTPTLSELIEACGDRFAYVAKDLEFGWRARADGGDSGSLPPCNGSTPEEAVTKLWLALNTKSNEKETN